MSKNVMCPYHPEAQLKRYGRADWRCPVDGVNMVFELVLTADALREDLEGDMPVNKYKGGDDE